MKVENYPKYTIIMRNYSSEQSDAVLQALEGLEDKFAVEVTMNTHQAVEEIKELNSKFGKKILIGAGTVLTFSEEIAAIDAGAKFILSACQFTKAMIEYAKKREVVTIPGVMTPTEVFRMDSYGADIIKVFPAVDIGARFFKNIQAPLGKLRLMAVGGVSEKNIHEFFENGAQYVGIGSNAFNKEDLKSLNIANLHQSLVNLVKKS